MGKHLGVALALAGLLVACKGSDTTDGSGNNGNGDGDTGSKQGTVSGMVADMRGQPLSDVKVIVDNTVLYDAKVTGRTGADGRYSVQVPPGNGAWRAYAEFQREYHGRTFLLNLSPDNPDSFTVDSAVTRNFQWHLTGKKPAPLVGNFGFTAYVFSDINNAPYDLENVELTFAPDGPLVDGSTGQTIKAHPKRNPSDAVEDLPLGRYTISARYLPPGQPSSPLRIRVEGQGDYADTVTADFEPSLQACTHCMRLEVAFP